MPDTLIVIICSAATQGDASCPLATDVSSFCATYSVAGEICLILLLYSCYYLIHTKWMDAAEENKEKFGNYFPDQLPQAFMDPDRHGKSKHVINLSI